MEKQSVRKLQLPLLFHEGKVSLSWRLGESSSLRPSGPTADTQLTATALCEDSLLLLAEVYRAAVQMGFLNWGGR